APAPTRYDEWVDTFGVTDLFTEFVTLGTYPCGCADSWMTTETGGTPATAPQAYADRSPILMGAAMKGLGHAYLVHGIGDPVVPYSESREMYAALLANGIPASFTTVTTGGGCTQLPYTPAGWLPCAPTPIGPAAHDGRGAGPAYGIIDRLLRGIVPDAGAPASEHIVDYTAGVSV
ncbi:MAG: alpha/beta hydrolase family protein, partial [Thermoplasmatota archaeon]